MIIGVKSAYYHAFIWLDTKLKKMPGITIFIIAFYTKDDDNDTTVMMMML